MRRKKDDKRVLRRGNGRNNNTRRPPHMRNRTQRKRKKRSNKSIFIMILILVAFIVGAGIGVLLSFDNGNVDANETHIENVTKEMTTNVNNTSTVVFEDADHVDYNENQSAEILGVEDKAYYNDGDLG